MFKNIYCLICKSIITSKETNLVSYIDTFEGVTVGKFPVNAGPLCISSFWRNSQKKKSLIRFKVTVELPNGKSKEMFTTGKLEIVNYTHRLNLNINSIKLDEAGEYKFITEYDKDDSGFQYGCEAILKVTVAQVGAAIK